MINQENTLLEIQMHTHIHNVSELMTIIIFTISINDYRVQVSQSAICPFLYLLQGQSLSVLASLPTQLRRRVSSCKLQLCVFVL